MVSTTFVAEIFTTDGINFSAKSAKLAGASFAKILDGNTNSIEKKAAKRILFLFKNNFIKILSFYIPDYNKT